METSSIIGYLVNTLKFKQEEKDHKSFYREIPIGGSKMVVIRISNHRTHLQTWADRYPKNLHPSKKITKRMGRNSPIIFRQKAFYSFVFEDEPSQNDTNVRDGRIITVYESVKQTRDIKGDRQLMLIGEALSTFISNQEQYDEQILGKLQPITNKIQENKTTKDMKKQTIKLNESQLRGLIKESIKAILNENTFESSRWMEIIEEIHRLATELEELANAEDTPMTSGKLDLLEAAQSILKITTTFGAI